jgi:hypothetical protein
MGESKNAPTQKTAKFRLTRYRLMMFRNTLSRTYGPNRDPPHFPTP